MKYIRLSVYILVFFIFEFETHAQAYEQLAADDDTWLMMLWAGDPHNNTYTVDLDKLVVSGDSSINGKTYKRIYDHPADSISSKGNLISLLRQDSTGKVFVINTLYGNNYQAYEFGCLISNSDSTEHLLYDFGMKKGDTTYYMDSFWNQSFYVTVTDIDSIFVGGKLRKRWHVGNNHNWEDSEWIDGIGSLSGLYGPYCMTFESGVRLACYFDNTTYYRRDPTKSCYSVGIDNPAIKHSDILVYPIPADEWINIELREYYNLPEVQLINIDGKIVLETKLKNERINISSIDQGFYILQIKSQGGITRKKILISR